MTFSKSIFYIFIIVFTSCKSSTNLIAISAIEKNSTILELNCPDKGICSLELLFNKSIEFKQDTFGMYYPVITSGNNTILKFNYKTIHDPTIQDSSYNEFIYAELNTPISNLTLENEALQRVKLFFGRLCFCKGTSGYFPVNKGKFQIIKNPNNTITIELDFSIKNIPQVISNLNETISLKSNETN